MNFPKRTISGTLLFFFLMSVLPGCAPSSEGPGPTLLIRIPEYLPGDSSGVYHSYGIAEHLIYELASNPQVSTYAPKTAAAASEVEEEAVAARFILESFLSTDDSTLSLDLMLIDTTRAGPVWTSRISSRPGVFPSSVRAIADTLLLHTTGTVVPVRPAPVSWKGTAYSWYLFGRYALTRPDVYNIADVVFALQRSLQDDPDSPQTHAALAWALLRDYEDKRSFAPYHVESASVQINEALMLGWRTGEAVRILALIDQYRSKFGNALALMEESVSLSPGDAESLRRISDLYLLHGRHDDAIEAARRSVLFDPLNERSHSTLARLYEMTDDRVRAIHTYEAGAGVSPDPERYRRERLPELLALEGRLDEAGSLLGIRSVTADEWYRVGRLYQIAGGHEELADAAFQHADSLLLGQLRAVPNDLMARSLRALVMARTGSWEDGESEVSRINADQNPHPIVLYRFARFYALKGDKEQAVGYLRKAVARKYVAEEMFDQDLGPIRGEHLLKVG